MKIELEIKKDQDGFWVEVVNPDSEYCTAAGVGGTLQEAINSLAENMEVLPEGAPRESRKDILRRLF